MPTSTYDKIVRANFGVLTDKEQLRLREGSVAVVGAGGVGGQCAIHCARLGIGTIRVIDKDAFEHSNLNRQMLSSTATLGVPKAVAAEQHLRAINPDLAVAGIEAWVTEGNAEELLDGVDVIVDCTDELVSRVVIHRTARALGIPSVWIAVTPPLRGAVATFTPDGMPYETVLGVPSAGRPLDDETRAVVRAQKDERARRSVDRGALDEWADAYLRGERPWAVITPVAGIVGTLAAFEAMKVLIDRPTLPPTVAPRLTLVDLAAPRAVETCDPPAEGWHYEDL